MNSSKNKERYDEQRKVSYWLEKLHIQREKIRRWNKGAKPLMTAEVPQIPRESNINATQTGINQNTKNIVIKNAEDKQEVNDLVKKSNRCIISISSLFPWDLFPNTIEVEESRVTFIFRQFLASQSHSLEIKDISNVFIEQSLFFATLQVVSRTYKENTTKVGNLSKEKAVQVQMIIEGLRTLKEHNINTSNYEIDELIAKIGEFHTHQVQ